MIVASGYTLAFDRLDPACDVGLVAPRMLGPEVRRCYEEGVGFITGVGVHRDATGHAQARTLAVAKAHRRAEAGRHRADRPPGGDPRPGRRAGAVARAAPGVARASCGVMMERGHPARGDPHRAVPLAARSSAPTGCCASRATPPRWSTTRRRASTASSAACPEFAHLDVAGPMREVVEGITSGALRRRVGRRARRRLPQVHRAQGGRRRPRHGRVRSRPAHASSARPRCSVAARRRSSYDAGGA